MLDKWRELQEKTAALSDRERIILAALTLVVVLIIWLQFVFTPVEKKSAQVAQNTATLNQQIAEQSEHMASLVSALQNNPNDELRREQSALKANLEDLHRDIEERLDNLVPPEKMADLMRDVLADYKGLRLTSARNLPVEPIHIQTPSKSEKDESETTNAQAVIFSHGFEMELSGGYFQTVEFLKHLEGMSGFYWQMLDYEVTNYPKAKVTIQLSTMSLEEDWIGV